MSPEEPRKRVARRTNLDPPLFVHLAEAYREEGLLDDAIRVCRDGLDGHPSCASGRIVLVRVLLERGAIVAAREECQRILEMQPAHGEALQLLAVIVGRQRPAGQGSDWRSDPLASPTLAALYAAQGHSATADAMYCQLGLTPGSVGEASRGRVVLETLLWFREGARRLRARAAQQG